MSPLEALGYIAQQPHAALLQRMPEEVRKRVECLQYWDLIEPVDTLAGLGVRLTDAGRKARYFGDAPEVPVDLHTRLQSLTIDVVNHAGRAVDLSSDPDASDEVIEQACGALKRAVLARREVAEAIEAGRL